MESQNGAQGKHNSQKTRKNIRGGITTGFLLITSVLFLTSLTLLYFLIDTQYKLDYSRGKFDAALDTISKKNQELESFQIELETANSRISTLNSKIDSLNLEKTSLNSEIISLNSKTASLSSEIVSLNSKIASLSQIKISRIDIVNNNCNNQYLFLDGRLAGGTRGGGRTYFYAPPGSHEFQVCGDPYRSNCTSKKIHMVDTEVFTYTITRHPSCP